MVIWPVANKLLPVAQLVLPLTHSAKYIFSSLSISVSVVGVIVIGLLIPGSMNSVVALSLGNIKVFNGCGVAEKSLMAASVHSEAGMSSQGRGGPLSLLLMIQNMGDVSSGAKGRLTVTFTVISTAASPMGYSGTLSGVTEIV